MNTVTNEHLDGALNRYVAACKRLELFDGQHVVVLSHGSKANGIAYRVNLRNAEHGGYCVPVAGDDFLGFTKRDAFEKLADRAGVLEDVARATGK
jgi:hypothetical protein